MECYSGIIMSKVGQQPKRFSAVKRNKGHAKNFFSICQSVFCMLATNSPNFSINIIFL